MLQHLTAAIGVTISAFGRDILHFPLFPISHFLDERFIIVNFHSKIVLFVADQAIPGTLFL